MKKTGIFLTMVCLLLTGLILTNNCHACSTFVLQDKSGHVVFGRNFDFPTGDCYITENKRNMTKTSFASTAEKSLQWTSKYGSISFNQFGAELPYGGMNEAGLVIEQMWMNGSKYSEIDDRHGLSVLQWIQYQLDMSATVNDVLLSDTTVRISKTSPTPLHFLVCDKKGTVATLEYLEGKLVVHQGKTLPYAASTNYTYDNCLKDLEQYQDFGGKEKMVNTNENDARFAIIAKQLKQYNKKSDVINKAKEILQSVTMDNTQWSIIYDLTQNKVYYKTKTNPEFKSFKLTFFNFNNKKPRLNVNIDSNLSKSNKEFVPYSYEVNLKHLKKVYGSLELFKNVPQSAIENTAKYPETLIAN